MKTTKYINLEFSVQFYFIISFVLLITAGAVLLYLPFSHTEPLTFLDAVFTATSATCVTGLVVVDTGSFFTFWGQCVVLSLIQLGALGLMMWSVVLVLFVGRNISLSQELYMNQILGEGRFGRRELVSFARLLVAFILVSELVGAALLTLLFSLKEGWHGGASIFNGIFHSVSAFCNAGFSLYSDSLVRYSRDPLVNLTFASLIVLGGIGFPVVWDIYAAVKKQKRALSLHTKAVVSTTAFLIVAGAAAILLSYVAEGRWGPWVLLYSFFQSITARTAGFNTVVIARMPQAAVFTLILLMVVGASPFSTGGGVKTTTLFVIYRLIASSAKNSKDVLVFGRRIPKKVVESALLVLSFYLTWVCFASYLIFLLQPAFSMDEVFFEVVSAMSTVGLSLGITSQLSSLSKVVIILTMFIGRLGPLTIVSLLASRRKPLPYTFPSEEVIIG